MSFSGSIQFRNPYCTSVAYPESTDLHSKLTEIEQKLETMVKRDDLVQTDQEVQTKIKSIAEAVKQLGNEVKKLEARVKAASRSGASDDDLIIQALQELKNREERSRCLRLLKMPKVEETSLLAQKARCLTLVDLFLSDGLKVNDVKVVDVFRLGREEPKVMIVKFATTDDVAKVVRSLKNLRYAEAQWQSVSVQRFFTRLELKTLKEEMEWKNNEAEHLGLGRPWIVSNEGRVIRRKTFDAHEEN